jgi:hypothetical protein
MSLFLQILLDDMKLDSIHRPMTSKKIIIQQIVFTQFIPFQVLEPSEDGPQGHVHFTKSKPIAISFVQKGSVAAKTYGIPTHILLPFPNGTNAFHIFCLSLVSAHRSGINSCAWGK